MASRIITCFSCTLYVSLLAIFTAIGFASLVFGAVGLGRFIPIYLYSGSHKSITCNIVDVQYDTYDESDYDVTWSVEYYVVHAQIHNLTFSTIRKVFDTLDEVSETIAVYKERTNHTCYYDQERIIDVTWDRPPSPKPYLIMMIVGLGLAALYIVTLIGFNCYRARKTRTVS